MKASPPCRGELWVTVAEGGAPTSVPNRKGSGSCRQLGPCGREVIGVAGDTSGSLVGVTSQTAPLLARTYQRPGGAPLVRLVAEPLIEAEDLTLSSVGLTRRTDSSDLIVGQAPLRAVGFPAWPVLTDPDNARHALNLVGDLEWARRVVRSRPEEVAKRFEKLTADLAASAPHFVPTLLEEVTRLFTDQGEEALARRMFSLAREVERSHDLAVDLDRHRAMFVEFAGLGAVGVREFTAEVKAAMVRIDDPGEAVDYVVSLIAGLAESGTPPHVAMVRDTRKVAARAGLTAGDSDRLVLGATLGTRGFSRATAGFFTALGTSMATYLRENPGKAEAFAAELPDELGIDPYLGILGDCGWLERHRTDGVSHVRWLADLITDNSYAAGQYSGRLIAEIRATAASGVVTLAGDSGTPLPWLHPTTLDALCAAGMISAQGTEVTRIWLDTWAREPVGDLDALAAHPVLGLRAITTLAERDIKDLTRHLDVLLAHSGSRTMLTRWLDDRASRHRDSIGALPERGRELLVDLPELADERLASLAPDAVRDLFTIDPVTAFTAAVREGVLVEYGWPALEETASTLGRDTGKEPALFDSFPQTVVAAGDRITVVEGDRVLRELVAPIEDKDILAVYTVGAEGAGAEIAVFLRDPDTCDDFLWWEGDTPRRQNRNAYAGLHGSLPLAGGRLLNDAMFTVHGELPAATWSSVIAVPGHDIVTVNNFGANYRMWDATGEPNGEQVTATTGEILRIPAVAEIIDKAEQQAGLPTGTVASWEKIHWESSWILPLPPTASPDNPLGAIDGAMVCLVGHSAGQPQFDARTQITPWGCVDEQGPAIVRPGGTTWQIRYDGLRSAGGRVLSRAYDGEGQRHILESLPHRSWCMPGIRDRDASARMRDYPEEYAREVIDALVPDPDRTLPVPDTYDVHHLRRDTVTTVNSAPGSAVVGVLARQLGTLDDLTLPVALSHLAADCVALSTQADELRTRLFSGGQDTSPVTAPPASTAPTVSTTLPEGSVSWMSPWQIRNNTAGWTTATNTLLSWAQPGHPTGTGFQNTYGSPEIDVAHLIGRERMLLSHWSSPLFPPEFRRPLAAFAREMVDAELWCGDWTSVTIILRPDLVEEFRQQPLGWHTVGVPVLSLHGEGHHPERNGNHVTVLTRRSTLGQLSVPVTSGPPDTHLGMGSEEFLAGLDQLDQLDHDHSLILDEDAVVRVHQTTGLATPTVRVLLGGAHPAQFLDAAEKKRYGLTSKQAALAGDQFHALGPDLIENFVAGVALPEPDLTLTDSEWERASALSVGNYRTAADVLTSLIYHGTISYVGGTMAALLSLAAEMPLSDTRRPTAAAYLRRIRDTAHQQILDPRYQRYLGTMDLGTSVTDKQFRGDVTPGEQTVRVATEGHLDDLVADLETVHPELPGCPLDPGNSVPELVVEIASALGVTEPAARYYLQLLALADPTDAHIRSWNGWRKKDIDAAATELMAGGLVVEAKRTGAGRTRSLPGGWIPGSKGINASRPTEAWTAAMYLMWDDVRARPVIPGCPPHRPVPELFTTAWRRITDGDTPGYEELSTTRHRVR